MKINTFPQPAWVVSVSGHIKRATIAAGGPDIFKDEQGHSWLHTEVHLDKNDAVTYVERRIKRLEKAAQARLETIKKLKLALNYTRGNDI